jgi:hypothetical protein
VALIQHLQQLHQQLVAKAVGEQVAIHHPQAVQVVVVALTTTAQLVRQIKAVQVETLKAAAAVPVLPVKLVHQVATVEMAFK